MERTIDVCTHVSLRMMRLCEFVYADLVWHVFAHVSSQTDTFSIHGDFPIHCLVECLYVNRCGAGVEVPLIR